MILELQLFICLRQQLVLSVRAALNLIAGGFHHNKQASRLWKWKLPLSASHQILWLEWLSKSPLKGGEAPQKFSVFECCMLCMCSSGFYKVGKTCLHVISVGLLFKLQTGSTLHTAECNKQELNKYLIVKQSWSKFLSLLGRAGGTLWYLQESRAALLPIILFPLLVSSSRLIQLK